MAVNQNAARAGKKFESDLVKYLRAQGFDAERLRLTGVEDEGDILLRTRDDRWVIEAKRRKAMNLSGWVSEAMLEAANYASHRSRELPGFVVVHYARGKGLGGSYVTTTLDEWLGHL